MTEFNNIPIHEGRLLVLTVIFTAVAVGLIVLAIFWLCSLSGTSDRSTARRIDEIKARGANDPKTKKLLKKLERKQKKLQKERRKTLIQDILFGALILSLLTVSLALCVIPGWTDYFVKDYVVYEGEFEVVRQTRNNRIILEDGTRISGSLGLSDGEHSGQVVYTKRSEIALGAKTTD
ncbi:MAG: hypothetical protein IJX47_08120 [Clostridia bacterium]|nr:hypothetical protein [Clostridia bacterium]